MKLCPVCGNEHQRKGKFCRDACKSKAYQNRLRANRVNTDNTVGVSGDSALPGIESDVRLSRMESALERIESKLESISNQQPAQQYQPSHIEQFAQMIRPAPLQHDDDLIDIPIAKAESNGDITTNFLRSVSAVAGVNLTQPEPRTIKINGQDTSMAQGIKRMEVPQFAPPSFDDDEL